ncbi:MAG UNVERIFIED_CONTAM: hypothetical protein LVR18_50500 [Planctomycetaceae bacterium]|jgi:hypothetical protein
MSSSQPERITLPMMREVLSVPLLCDALDAAGFPNQSPRLPIFSLTMPQTTLIGRCRTSLWADMAHTDPRPYELELQAVDSCSADDVLICAGRGFDAFRYLGRTAHDSLPQCWLRRGDR